MCMVSHHTIYTPWPSGPRNPHSFSYAVPSHVHPTRFERAKQEKERPETRQAAEKDKGQQVK